jgi:tetratricopeptide (TPR) repeat protein
VIEGINQAIELNAEGNTDLAVRRLAALIEEFPAASSAHAYLAWFLSNGGHFSQAVEHARRAVEMSKESERASLVLFHVLWKAGQANLAIAEIRRFLGIRPSEEHARILSDWEAGGYGLDGNDWNRKNGPA